MAIGSVPLLTIPVKATAVLAAGRAVTGLGAIPAAAGRILGVARVNAAVGDVTPVDVDGTTAGEAGAAIPIDQALEVDAQGRFIPKASGVTVGRALSAATAAGQMVEVLLIAN